MLSFSVAVYDVVVFLLGMAIKSAAPFYPKARLWVDGRKYGLAGIKWPQKNGKRIWFHCASLGEFEQARPLIDKIAESNQQHIITLTFFSPSGYEVRKNYSNADLVAYLPLDTKQNAVDFITEIKPDLVFFTKYDLWFHFVSQLREAGIPLVLFSAVFRPNQVYFSWYGDLFREMLKSFSVLFVQNKGSADLLQEIKIDSIIAKDTRFDRVLAIANQPKRIDFIEQFKGSAELLIAGSTWPTDETLISDFINTCELANTKFVIAPHDIDQERIQKLTGHLNKKTIRLSELNADNAHNANVIIVDSIGLLSSFYAYANIAYVGGGFNRGVHNVLEPTVFNIPVVFGPRYSKSEEAKDLVKLEVARSIEANQFSSKLSAWLEDRAWHKKAAATAKQYFDLQKGGTDTIFEYIKLKKWI